MAFMNFAPPSAFVVRNPPLGQFLQYRVAGIEIVIVPTLDFQVPLKAALIHPPITYTNFKATYARFRP
jgi:hypothetical protein